MRSAAGSSPARSPRANFCRAKSELAEQFGVSRQAVREALKVLAAKGLVTSRRRAGTFVVPRANWNLLDPDVIAWHPPEKFSPAFLRDIIELRRLIEPAAAAFAAERGGAEQVARIAAALAAMTSAERSGRSRGPMPSSTPRYSRRAATS